MSYQVLARKWRPRSFEEMAGQGHVLKTLINALDSQRLHHAYLFTGTRGVGKTTIARILARCLNCEQGVTSKPCGECSACREIGEGRFIDLIEVDAASRTKVEDTRELLENVQYAPSRGRYKVYLIDEVHMLSTHSFNALLKTLEEPPPHVKFLLATTDPQKLPVTVLSRCLQFNLKNLSPERLVEHIRHILDVEGIGYEEGALWHLGRAAQGSVRDCLTLLDQAIAYCEGQLSEKGVSEFLGNIDRGVILRLMEALIASDGAALLAEVARVAEHSPDFAALLRELLSWLHRVALAQVVPDGIDNSQGDREQVLSHAAALPAEVVQLYYQIALKGREDLSFAPDARAGLEMTLLRMLAFTPAGIPELPKTPLPGSEGSQPATAEKKKSPLVEAQVPTAQPDDIRPATAAEPPVPEPVANAELQTKVQPVPARPADTSDSSLVELQPGQWIELFGKLALSGVTRSIAANCELREVDGQCLHLVLQENQGTLYSDEHRKRIEQALREHFGTPVTVALTLGTVAAETPAEWRRRIEAERRQAAVAAFEQDPLVQAMMERFGAEIQYDSIAPLAPQS